MHTIIADLSRQPNSDKQPVPPSISTRAFIQWLPDPPSEPTSTLVLTSSEKFFVDIRVLRNKDEPCDTKGNGEASPKTIKEEEEEDSKATLSNDIDWAFAGRSQSTKDEATGIASSRWIHTVDSRFLANPESAVDQAEMLPEDPESGITLEKGSMVNPATGKETAYVEGWRETNARNVPDAPEDVRQLFERELSRRGIRLVECDPHLRRMSRANEKSGFPAMSGNPPFQGGSGLDLCCVVLQHENTARRSRGTVIRVGQFCQGVLQVGETFAAERWEWTSRFGWQRVFSSGNLDIPCDVACYMATTKLRAGSKVKYGVGDDQVWQCVEEEVWTR